MGAGVCCPIISFTLPLATGVTVIMVRLAPEIFWVYFPVCNYSRFGNFAGNSRNDVLCRAITGVGKNCNSMILAPGIFDAARRVADSVGLRLVLHLIRRIAGKIAFLTQCEHRNTANQHNLDPFQTWDDFWQKRSIFRAVSLL